MIQFNNVTSAVNGSTSTSPTSAMDASTLQSFESALSEAVTQTLEQFGINPNSVNISVAPTSTNSASSGAAATTNASTTATTNSTAVVSPAVNSSAGTGSSSPAVETQSAAPLVDQSNGETPDASYDTAYWAKQPAAVQALQNISDPGERTQAAMQLASQGYSIDVPIMVWNWDPSIVTSLREGAGYTWVPSGLQSPLQSTPGFTPPGATPYDPNNPPPGSIAV